MNLHGLRAFLRIFIAIAPVVCSGQQIPLRLHRPLLRELGTESSSVFSVPMHAGRFAHLVVEQQGVDVAVKIISPSGQPILVADSPNDLFGPEPASWIAEETGTYQIRVEVSGGRTEHGKYRIELENLRTPTKADHKRIEAEQAFFEAVNTESKLTHAEAIKKFEHSAELWRAVNDGYEEAMCRNIAGHLYEVAGDRQKALAYYRQAETIRQAIGDRIGEATTLNDIGVVENFLGETRKALECYQEAQAIRPTTNTLLNIGAVDDALGQHEKALEIDKQALQMLHESGDRSGEAKALNNIGVVYQHLDDKQQALEFYFKALKLREETGDRPGQATTVSNIGAVYSDLDQKQKALEYYGKALVIRQQVHDQSGEATTLNNIGTVYQDQHEWQKALDHYTQALTIRREMGDRTGEATTRNNIGHLCAELGDRDRALEQYGQALPIARAVGDRSLEATILGNLSVLFEATPEMAIFLEKQAVNALQSMRRDDRGLEEPLRKSFESSIEFHYRHLASLLVDRERFGEAEEVLNLLKDKEANDYARRDAITDQLKAADLRPDEQKARDSYDQIVGQIMTLGQQSAALESKKDKDGALSAAEQELSAKIAADLQAAQQVLNSFLQQQEKVFSSKLVTDRIGSYEKESSGVMDVLPELGPGTVAIYTLVMPDKYIAILVTSGARKAYTTQIKEADLNRKIFEFRRILQNPSSNPLPLAQEMYRVVFPEGLRQDLDAIHAQTIMWSIDSTLRYIPMAALHDGKNYLVVSFRNSLITPASLTQLTKSPAKVWAGIGFGVSEAKANFPALPSVPAELRGIFKQEGTEGAPMTGPIRLNAEFTRTSFEGTLRGTRNLVVHIATHFDSRPGGTDDSHLLLGDGSEMSLADIAAQPNLFRGLDLLTLSACSTAFANGSEDGREVDSFGTIAQEVGAKAVIASLWSVDDASTATLMQTMYSLRQATAGMPKTEALREAQAQMASGQLKPQKNNKLERRAFITEDAATRSEDWTHPFYWAPFILIGNWR